MSTANAGRTREAMEILGRPRVGDPPGNVIETFRRDPSERHDLMSIR